MDTQFDSIEIEVEIYLQIERMYKAINENDKVGNTLEWVKDGHPILRQ